TSERPRFAAPFGYFPVLGLNRSQGRFTPLEPTGVPDAPTFPTPACRATSAALPGEAAGPQSGRGGTRATGAARAARAQCRPPVDAAHRGRRLGQDHARGGVRTQPPPAGRVVRAVAVGWRPARVRPPPARGLPRRRAAVRRHVRA